MTENYLRYYNLEEYLFDDVHRRFHETKTFDAFDLFSIIIWKANRAKSKLAKRLISSEGDLESAARAFSAALWNAQSPQERLRVAMSPPWKFYLPMATSILSVLWPEEFTVYDVRVCGELNGFDDLGNLPADSVWDRYCEYRSAVDKAVPESPLLRDKDRYLWARSAANQLREDIRTGFPTEKERVGKK